MIASPLRTNYIQVHGLYREPTVEMSTSDMFMLHFRQNRVKDGIHYELNPDLKRILNETHVFDYGF